MVMPENIDMKFDDFCEGCIKCDLQIKETNVSTLFNVVSVRCENRDVCRMWNKKMRGEQKVGQGRWIDVIDEKTEITEMHHDECSNCGYHGLNEYSYCPNCGSKMEVEE